MKGYSMPTKYKLIVKLAVIGGIALYTWKQYDNLTRKLKMIPVAGKLFK